MGSLSIALIAFIQGIIVTRVLGASQYGILGVIMTYCLIIKTLLSYRTSEPLTQFMIQFKLNNKKSSLEILIKTSILVEFITNLVAFTVIIIAAPIAAKYISGGKEFIHLYWIYGFTVLFTFLDATWYSVARDLKYFKLLSILPAIYTLVKFIIIILLFYMKCLNLFWLVVTYLITRFGLFISIAFLLIWNLNKKYQISLFRMNWNQCFKFNNELSDFWKFMNISYLSSLITPIIRQSDILILGYYKTDSEVGIYKLAKNLVSIIQAFSGALTSVIYQDINEIVISNKYSQLKKDIINMSKIWIPTIVVGLILAIINARFFIKLIYGNEFANASLPFLFLLTGVSVTMSLFWAQPVLLALKKFKEYLIINLTIGIFFILFTFILVPLFGCYASAILLGLSWALDSIFMLIIILKIKELGQK